MAISNDTEFKTALNKLTVAQQRQAASRFVENVLPLCKDARVKGAVTAARRQDITDAELTALFQATKSASVESFTQCGREADWLAQAGHFVAEAAMACVKAVEAGDNLAWNAGMSARMARTCEAIAGGAGTENSEAAAQYRILAEFLNQ
jgi:hypothetical protein